MIVRIIRLSKKRSILIPKAGGVITTMSSRMSVDFTIPVNFRRRHSAVRAVVARALIYMSMVKEKK